MSNGPLPGEQHVDIGIAYTECSRGHASRELTIDTDNGPTYTAGAACCWSASMETRAHSLPLLLLARP